MSCHIIAATTAAAAAAELTTTLTLDTTQLPLPASCLSQLVEQHEADREKEREQQKKQRERDLLLCPLVRSVHCPTIVAAIHPEKC